MWQIRKAFIAKRDCIEIVAGKKLNEWPNLQKILMSNNEYEKLNDVPGSWPTTSLHCVHYSTFLHCASYDCNHTGTVWLPSLIRTVFHIHYMWTFFLNTLHLNFQTLSLSLSCFLILWIFKTSFEITLRR